MKVLVTGASGLLGAGVARALAERGDSVTVLQRRPAGLGVREVRGDVADPTVVDEAVAGQDAVVHLAAKVNVVGPWPDYERVNVGGTSAVIGACRRHGVSRLVQVSTPSVAHAGASLVGAPAGHADPAATRGPYARSKAMAELLALAADKPGFAVAAIRPHLVWGPGDTQLVARIVERARAGRLPVLGSGAALVDTIYIDNAVDALVAALDRCPAIHGQALVVTNGEPRPIAELLGAFAEAGGASRPGRRVPVGAALAAGSLVEALWRLRARFSRDPEAGRDDDPPITRFVAEQMTTAHWFDQRRTRELLGWAPTVSLDEGLERLRRSYLVDGSGVRG